MFFIFVLEIKQMKSNNKKYKIRKTDSYYLKLLSKSLNRNSIHDEHHLSFNLDLLLHYSSNMGLLMLYVTLRRYARHKYGNFSGIIRTLTQHQRKVLLPQLLGENLITKDHHITNHRNHSLQNFSNRFIKLPNNINTKTKLKAFILAATETYTLFKKHYAQNINTEPEVQETFKDQQKVNKLKTQRLLRKFSAYSGSVYRQTLAKKLQCSDSTVSRLRKFSPNNYKQQGYLVTDWMGNNAFYSMQYNLFFKRLPSNINSKIEFYFIPFKKTESINQSLKSHLL